MRRALALAAALAAACVPEEGPLMAANQDCLACHGRGEARGWTVAGTFGGRGSRVTITDANGWTITLRTAENGNFYTAEPLVFPLRVVSVDGRPMSNSLTGALIPVKRYGGCNVCHGPGGATIMGELMAPGTDCLICHDGSGIDDLAHTYSLAGTWSRPGLTVSVRDATGKTFTLPAPTNAAGNFFTTEPLTFPVRVTVGGETMDDAPYGGCNACHGRGGEADDD